MRRSIPVFLTILVFAALLFSACAAEHKTHKRRTSARSYTEYTDYGEEEMHIDLGKASEKVKAEVEADLKRQRLLEEAEKAEAAKAEAEARRKRVQEAVDRKKAEEEEKQQAATARDKAIEAKQAELDKKKKALEESEAERKSMLFTSEYDTLKDDQLDEVIAQYEKFVEKYINLDKKDLQDPNKNFSNILPKVLHRLADLYVKKENLRYERDMTRFEQQLECYKRGECSDPGPFPLKEFDRAIELYEKLLALWPTRTDNDKVLYQLSFCYDEQGDYDKAREVLMNFIAKYPKHKSSQVAWFRLGEAYFEEGNLDDEEGHKNDAIGAYMKVAEFSKDSFYYDKGLYKLAWTYYRLSDYDKAIKVLANLVDVTIEKAKKEGEYTDFDNLYGESRGLIRETLQMMASSFSDFGGIDRMKAFFKKRKRPDWEQQAYMALGEFLTKEERFDEAIKTYSEFLKSFPTYSKAPEFYKLIIDVYMKDKNLAKANEYREMLVTNLSKESRWWKANKAEAREKMAPIRQETCYQLALYNHALAQEAEEKGKPEDALSRYRSAVKWYNTYLGDYPEGKDAAEMASLMGDAYYALKQYGNAAKAYEKAAWDYEPKADDKNAVKRKHDSAYGAITAWEELLNIQMEELKSKAGGKKMDMGELLKKAPAAPKLVTACVSFVKAFPDDKAVPDIVLKGAEVLFKTEKYEQARTAYRHVIEHFPDHPKNHDNQRNIAASYFAEKDYPNAEIEYRKALASSPTKGEREEIRTLLASCVYKQGEKLKAAGKYKEAAETFFRVAEDVPESTIAPAALFDSAIQYRQAADTENFTRVMRELAKRHPENELAAKGLIMLGKDEETQGKIREAVGDYLEASRIYEKQGQSENAGKLLLVAARRYQDLKDWPEVIKRFTEYKNRYAKADLDGQLEATVSIANAQYNQNMYEEAVRTFKQVIEIHERAKAKNPDIPNDQAARAAFLIGEHLYKSYARMKLTLPLKRSLTAKSKLLEGVLEYYAQSANYKVQEYTTASSYKIGLALLNFRDSILNSEVPLDVRKDQFMRSAYRDELEMQAFPYEEKAIAALEANVKVCQKNHVWNEWIDKSYEKLAQLIPGRYLKKGYGEELFCKALF